uniref:centromere protein J isoform X1 n=1 Tax=Podarcis muralis TaxID=64176 RepID=UPI0010A03651|nr:centromere protein J isoform X1 [Podarcis muralis]XP_028582098.1 centromere protein J isoform X1 [Podarcis muralis]XP_028582099.1 centromere protein J isoform X1 [Podarcis muralis]
MATSTDLNWEENLIAHWMSNAPRAGVILNPAFHSLKTTRALSIDDASPGISSNSLHSSSSISLSENSLQIQQAVALSSPCGDKLDVSQTLSPISFAKEEQMLIVKDAPGQWVALQSDTECDLLDGLDEECCTDLLLQKLEQLKGLQQHKQEQLKRQQMEQIQRLMEEQQKLLSMVSEQQTHTGFRVMEDCLSQRCDHPSHSPPVPSLPPHRNGDSVYWNSGPCIPSPVEQKDSLQKPKNGQILKGTISADPFCEREALDLSFKMQNELKVEDQNDISGEISQILEQNLLGNADGDISCKSTRDAETSESRTGGKCLETPNAEERPVAASIQERKQTFEEFLEEQIRLEEQRLSQKGNKKDSEKSTFQTPVAKRPFLKRGEGLRRFAGAKCKAANQKESKVTHLNASEVKNSVKADKPQLHRKTATSNKEQSSDNFVSKNGNQNGKMKKAPALPARKTAVLRTCAGKAIPSSTRRNPSERKSGQLREFAKSEINGEREKNKDNIMALAKLDEISCELPKEKYAQPAQVTKHLTNSSEKDLDLSFELSFQKKLENWDTEKEKEEIELDEFLFLEQAADEISFASNSSLIVRILDQGQQISTGRRLSSTPVKSRQQQQQINVQDATAVENRNGDACLSQPANNEKDRGMITESQASEMLKDHQNKIDSKMLQAFPTEFQGFRETEWDEDKSGESSDVTLGSEEEFETTIKPAERAKKFDLSRRGDSPEFSEYKEGTNGDASLGLLEKKVGSIQCSKINKGSEFQTVCCANGNQVDFDDETSWTDFDENGSRCTQVPNDDLVIKGPLSPDCSATNEAFFTDKRIKRKIAVAKKGDVLPRQSVADSEAIAPPTTDLMLKLFPSLRPKQKVEAQQRHDAKPNMSQEESGGDTARSQLLREKLVELEVEIERFREENASLTKLREEREKDLETFRKEVADFEQQKTKELARIEEFKKEETRKLQKERKVFEKYAQAARAIPDKKERDEIQALKQQMATLQEDLKRRETKWSTTHIRLRDQIEALTRENVQLREEIKIMERFRLDAWKRKEASINKKKTGCDKKAESAHSPAVLQKNQTLPSIPQAEKSSKMNGKSDLSSEGRPCAKFKLAAVPEESCLNNVAVTFEDSSKAFMANLPSNGTVELSPSLSPDSSDSEDEIESEASHPDGKVEKILKNGSHLIIFPNGTRKEVSCDGKTTTVTFFNGDVKQVLDDRRVIYYYADAKTTHTTYPTGLEVLHFSNGQIEKHFPDGRKEIVFPDQTIKNVYTDGREMTIFPDGTIVRTQQDGSKVIEFSNGQQEVHTAHFKRREYPDGTVKTMYADGRQETQYASGRVRVKDKDGEIIVDTIL